MFSLSIVNLGIRAEKANFLQKKLFFQYQQYLENAGVIKT